MKNKILFISSNYPPRVGGPASTVPKLASTLSKHFDISVIAFREKGFKNHEKKDFELFRSPTFMLFGFSNPLSVAIRTVLISIYSRIVLVNNNTKIIHAHDAHISTIAALFCRHTTLRGIKVISKYAGDLALEFSGLDEEKGKSIEEIMNKPTLKQKLLLAFQKLLFNSSDYIHVQNNYQKGIVTNFYNISPRKIIIVPNPVDTNLFKPIKTKKHNEFTILVVSRIVPWKGIETVIRALPLIRKSIPSARLKIIGLGPETYVNSLKKLAQEVKMNNNIEFFGKVENKLLPKEYNKAHIFVQASLYEPFGITAIEASSCGIPIVVSNVGGLPELSPNKNSIFESNNEVDLAKNVIASKKFTPNSNLFTEYSLENITKILHEVYLNILK